MTFANPEILLLLLLIPVVALLYLFRASQGNLSLTIAHHEKSFSNPLDKLGFHLPTALRLLCVAFLVIALARPQFGQSFTTSSNKGVNIMLAIDTSQSMTGIDMKIRGETANRLDAAKMVLKDFIAKRTTDRLGLLVFGEQAYTQCPLTIDHGAILDLLDNVQIGMVGDATAIGSAIAVGVKRLKDVKAKSKILVLLTDGQNTAGNISPKTAMELAKRFDIKIYTIGIGQEGEVPFKIQTPQGERIINQQVQMDEDTLVSIAEETGGRYFRASNTEALSRVYDSIDKLEKTKIEVKQYSSYKDVYEPFLWFAFLFFLLEVILGNTLFFRIN